MEIKVTLMETTLKAEMRNLLTTFTKDLLSTFTQNGGLCSILKPLK